MNALAVIEYDHAAFAQMSDRAQVTSLFQQFEKTCVTAQKQAEAGKGAAAWRPVLADLRAKLPDLTFQYEVPPVVQVSCLSYFTIVLRHRFAPPNPFPPPPTPLLSCAKLRCGLTVLALPVH